MTVLISKREAAARVGMHPESLMRLTRQGLFPKPVRVGVGPQAHVKFSEQEVEAHVAGLLAQREGSSNATVI